jgi:RNA polymerase sigma-70 factor, ECF subfamily
MNSAQAQPESSEATVIRLVLDGNADAFCELLRPYQRGLYRKALSIVGSEADAEEVAQSAVLKAFNKLPQFRHDAEFRTWLTSITINEARMWLRDNRKHRHESLDCEDGGGRRICREFADSREGPFQLFERKEVSGAILKALTQLPAIYRQVFILRDLQLLSISETARALGISELNVKTRLRRSRLQMRRALTHLRSSRTSKRDHGPTAPARDCATRPRHVRGLQMLRMRRREFIEISPR